MDKYQHIVDLLERALPDYFFLRDPIERYKSLPKVLKDGSLDVYEAMKKQNASDAEIATTIYLSIIFNHQPFHFPGRTLEDDIYNTRDLHILAINYDD